MSMRAFFAAFCVLVLLPGCASVPEPAAPAPPQTAAPVPPPAGEVLAGIGTEVNGISAAGPSIRIAMSRLRSERSGQLLLTQVVTRWLT